MIIFKVSKSHSFMTTEWIPWTRESFCFACFTSGIDTNGGDTSCGWGAGQMSVTIDLKINPWKSSQIYGNQWKSMKINENQWKSMEINENWIIWW